MKGTDRNVLFVIPVVVLVMLLWFMMISPKREESSKLDQEIGTLEGSIAEQEQISAGAEEARLEFPKYYGRLVVLGKAVPEEADSASLLVQLNSIAAGSNIAFDSIEISAGASATGAEAPAPAAPPAEGTEEAPPAEGTPATTDTSSAAAATTSASAASGGVAAPATETAAASLPIGATVGPAGLPIMPYTLTFSGGFFDMANFFDGVDRLVNFSDKSDMVVANGRLVTVDGFVIKGAAPLLETKLAVTTYITPAEQGLTGGASPVGPAPGAPIPAGTTAAPPSTVPASSGVTP
jgi:Tfp pilus assembly protein PilO